MRFEIRETGQYHPVYEGVDFLQLRLAELAIRDLKRGECWVVLEEGDTSYEQQITQENTIIETNTILDPFDRISIRDERDDEWWVYYREEIKEFNEVMGNLAVFATTCHYLYPTKDMAQVFFARKDREIEAL